MNNLLNILKGVKKLVLSFTEKVIKLVSLVRNYNLKEEDTDEDIVIKTKSLSDNSVPSIKNDAIVTSEDIEPESINIEEVYIISDEIDDMENTEPEVLIDIDPSMNLDAEDLYDPYVETPEEEFQYNCGQCFNCYYFNKENDEFVMGNCRFHKREMLEDDGCVQFDSKY